MSKTTDDKIEVAARQGELIAPEPPEPRLRKVPGYVMNEDLEIIREAIALKRALTSYSGNRFSEGGALVEICQEWLHAESSRLSGKGGT